MNQAGLVAARFEFIGWPENQDDPCKRSLHFFDRYAARAGSRIIQTDLALADSFEDEEVIEIPEQDHRWFELQKGPYLASDATALETYPPGCLQKVARLASIPSDSAVDAELFKRNPEIVIAQNDPERCCAALDRLHLKKGWGADSFWPSSLGRKSCLAHRDY